MNKININLVYLLLILFSCSEKKEDSVYSNFYFEEKAMIINTEQDNSIEGTYLKIESIQKNIFKINSPNHFYITETKLKKWVIGWGSNQDYYDNGSENIRKIISINPEAHTVLLGELLRGKGFPKKNQTVVFWNRSASDFTKTKRTSLIDLTLWKEFAGTSNSFGGIGFDLQQKHWVMLFQECDTSKKQIYAAESSNLTDWKAANQGNPIMRYKDFKNIKWAAQNYRNKQTPIISDLQFINNRWTILLNGIDKNGKRNVGIAHSKKSILGPYTIHEKAILQSKPSSDWNSKGNFSAKIAYNSIQQKYILAFTGLNKEFTENVGIAFSKDLIHWNMSPQNPVISNHSGWRSKPTSSEVDYLNWKKNNIELILSGTKQLNQGFYVHYISKEANKAMSGNVDDAQLGLYVSKNNGNTFYAHKNNPLIINDYTDFSENQHMGGNLKFIDTDSLTYFFYQAKTNQKELKYSIYLRTKNKTQNKRNIN